MLREYLKYELDENDEEVKPGQPIVHKKLSSVSNILTGLLCAF